MSREVLDTRGLRCPVPANRTRDRLKGMAPGAELTVLGDDPLFVLDGRALADPTPARGSGDLAVAFTPPTTSASAISEWCWSPDERDGGAGARHQRSLMSQRVFVALLTIAVYLDYLCGVYVSSVHGVKVPDIILNHFGPIDLSPLFVYGYAILITVMFLYPLMFCRPMFHVVVFQFSPLLIVRSLAMIFAHLGTPAGAVPVTFPWFFQKLYFENDMFFPTLSAWRWTG